MLQTYKATLRGNHLEWNGTAPQSLSDDQPVAVHVTILDQEPIASAPTSGQEMAAILDQLSRRPAFSSISDPVAWQREQRSERTFLRQLKAAPMLSEG